MLGMKLKVEELGKKEVGHQRAAKSLEGEGGGVL
jgi:hypothetical protein